MPNKTAGDRDQTMAHGTRSATSWPRHRAKARKRKAIRKVTAMWAQRARDAVRNENGV